MRGADTPGHRHRRARPGPATDAYIQSVRDATPPLTEEWKQYLTGLLSDPGRPRERERPAPCGERHLRAATWPWGLPRPADTVSAGSGSPCTRIVQPNTKDASVDLAEP